MNIEVLISCMHQEDHSIVYRTNIQSDVVVINQTDKNQYETYYFTNNKGRQCRVKFISTVERGLSKSRNMAIKNATGDICLICDDDEILDDHYVETILETYNKHPNADIAAFTIKDTGKKYPKDEKRINYISALQLASWQISFRREKLESNNIWFDETLGSGVSKAGGEENMFIYDSLRKHLNIFYFPRNIGRMIEGNSQWFAGCTNEFFFDRGVMTKKLMGRSWALLYAIYYLLSKHHWYKKDISFLNASKAIFRGIFK